MIEFHIGIPHTDETWPIDESIFRFKMASLKKKHGKIPEPLTGEDSLDGTVYKYWAFPDEELWIISDTNRELEKFEF